MGLVLLFECELFSGIHVLDFWFLMFMCDLLPCPFYRNSGNSKFRLFWFDGLSYSFYGRVDVF